MATFPNTTSASDVWSLKDNYKAEAGDNWPVNAQYVAATGGTVTTDGDYKIHVFNSSSTFTVTNAGNAAGSNTVEYLVIAGGGGGGYDLGGGGGAGGYRTDTGLSVSATAYSITVGGGGAGASSAAKGSNGSNSVFSAVTSTGGGGAGSFGSLDGATGGSGGGARYEGGSGGSGSTDAESIVGYTINVAGRDHDSILMFNEDTEQWVAKNTLNNHVIDGGDY